MFSTNKYKICFILDSTSMLQLQQSGGVKPLDLIWMKRPDLWNKKNTLHVDDLIRYIVYIYHTIK
jgi:hypothetical protein